MWMLSGFTGIKSPYGSGGGGGLLEQAVVDSKITIIKVIFFIFNSPLN